MIIEWTAELISGNKKVDNQHKALFEKTNELYEAVDNGEEDAITNLLDFLEDYVVRHFQDEEKYMKKARYRGLEEHKNKHTLFTIEVAKRIRDYKITGYEVNTIRSTQKFISQWLYNHVLKVDLDMIKKINSQK